jgi:molybdopterin-synthase adenylyltransferase
MTIANIRLPADVHATMMADITRREEWAGYLLCGTTRRDSGWTLLGREWCPVPPRFQIRGTRYGLTWHPDFDVEMLNRSQKEGVSCIVIHHHGGANPKLSEPDENTRDSLLPFLSSNSPNRPHGFVVLGNRTLTGDAYLAGEHIGAIARMRVSGQSLQDWGAPQEARLDDTERQRLDRSIRAFGQDGQARLKSARVGIVGCGGGGAHVVQQLAYVGIGAFVLVDADIVDETSLNRLIGAVPAGRRTLLDRLLGRRVGDVGRRKVDVMQRLITGVNPAAHVAAFAEFFPSQKTVDALRVCDVLIACVDKLQVRDDLNRFAKRFVIPMVDIGIQIHDSGASQNSGLTIAGRITKVLADGPCLRCQGVVDDNKLTNERGGQAPGYTGPVGIPDPAVVTLNGVVASIAATEILQLLTGFASGKGPNAGWIYDGVTGLVEGMQKNVVGCTACLAERAAGQPV